ncbi:MAG: hypothetical protein WBM86_28380 [Waterburya sp.]
MYLLRQSRSDMGNAGYWMLHDPSFCHFWSFERIYVVSANEKLGFAPSLTKAFHERRSLIMSERNIVVSKERDDLD